MKNKFFSPKVRVYDKDYTNKVANNFIQSCDVIKYSYYYLVLIDFKHRYYEIDAIIGGEEKGVLISYREDAHNKKSPEYNLSIDFKVPKGYGEAIISQEKRTVIDIFLEK